MRQPLLSAIVLALGLVLLGAHAAPAGAASVKDPADLGPPRGAPIEEAMLAPPAVPPPIHRNYPARVIVHLETREVVK
ncbi:hypothetical protein [Metallibacterium sp.]|nr:hypothetical protein [Metallibacterium sp.]